MERKRLNQMNTASSTKFGLIGCGDMGSVRAAAIGDAGLQLTAVSDVDPKRLNGVASRSKAQAEVDWRTLVNRTDVDAVIVSTPPNLHAEMCIEALRAGKHVLCEKPLARSPEECRKIIDVAEKSGKFLATGFNYRFLASFEMARHWLQTGVIGRVSYIKSYAGYSARDHHQQWLHDVQITGGGALRDNGIHLIDLTRLFLGEVTEVNGFATNGIWKFKDCEDDGFLTMRNPDGAIASLHASWTEFRRYRFIIEIFGTLGVIRVSCFPMFADLIQVPSNGEASKKKTYYFPYLNVMEHLRSYRWIVKNSVIKELTAFSAATHNERTYIATGYDGLRAIEIAAAATNKLE